MKKLGVYIVFFLMSLLVCRAQDAVFSLYNASYLHLNPAFSALEPMLSFSLNARQQYRKLENPYNSNQFSLISPIVVDGEQKGGVGGSVFTEKAGVMNTTGFFLSAGYKLKFHPQQSISFGFQGGYMIRSLDEDKYQWNSQYNNQSGSWDPDIPKELSGINSSVGILDLNAGVIYYHSMQEGGFVDGRGLFLGASAYHLNEPSNSLLETDDSKLSRMFKFHGGIGMYATQKIVVTPMFLTAFQENFAQYNFGVSGEYILATDEMGLKPSSLYAGSWYRLDDSFIFSLGLGNDVYRIDLAYDMNATSLKRNFGGNFSTFEIALQLRKPPKGATVTNHLPRYRQAD